MITEHAPTPHELLTRLHDDVERWHDQGLIPDGVRRDLVVAVADLWAASRVIPGTLPTGAVR